MRPSLDTNAAAQDASWVLVGVFGYILSTIRNREEWYWQLLGACSGGFFKLP